jgi:hypothetical protein
MEAIPNYTILNLFVISEEVYCHRGISRWLAGLDHSA